MKTSILLVLLALAIPTAWAADKPKAKTVTKVQEAPPFELKGIMLGSGVSDLKNKYDLPCLDTVSARADVLCETQYDPIELRRFAGILASYIGFSYYGDKLGHVIAELPAYGFAAITDAFTAKYGKPGSIEKSDIRTKGGVTYTNETVKWLRPGQCVEVRKYYGKVDAMAILVYQDSYHLEHSRRLDEVAKENARSL